MLARGGISIALLAPLAAPAHALTMGEVSQTARTFVSTECADAFGRHQALWPDETAQGDVIWRNDAVFGSEQEITTDTPDLLDHLPRLTAWQLSGFSLVDDLTLASAFVTQDEAPSAQWLSDFDTISESLKAAADVYDCARMSDEAFAAAVADGAGEGLLLTVGTFDCLSAVSHRIAGTYDAAASPAEVQRAALPLVAEIDACEGGQ